MNTSLQMLIMTFAGWVSEHQRTVIAYLQEENRVLRELHRKKRLRFNNDQRRRLAAKGKAEGRRVLSEIETLVTPDTILQWHRELIVRKYDGSEGRGPGRPAVAQEIRELVVRMATANERWGYTRIVGELAKVGHQVSRSTVRRILREHGIGPAPERLSHMPWSKFLAAHWEAIAAADFFTVEVWTAVGLVLYLVFLVLDLTTRRVGIAGIAPAPTGFWMSQVARNLVDEFDGFPKGKRYLIHDRDPLYTRDFRARLSGAGVDSVRLPARSPNLNAIRRAFSFSRSSRSAWTGWCYWESGTFEAPDRGRPQSGLGPVTCHSRLGGLLSHYTERAA